MIIDDNYNLKRKLITVNQELLNSGLKPMSFIPTSNEDYIDIDTINELYEIEDVPEDDNERDKWYSENYERISGELEDLNIQIEEYMREIDKQYGVNYAPSGMSRIMQQGGETDFVSAAETQRKRVENMNEQQRAEELSKEVIKIYPRKTNKIFKPEDGIVKVYANIYKLTPDYTAEIFTENASKIVDELFEQGGETFLTSQNKTGYEKFKVIHQNGVEEFDYYSDALESFEKHKKQGHTPRLEGWYNDTDFKVIMRTPKYQKGDKVMMFDDEPVLTVEKVNEWSDKLATYDLSSADGVIERRNISETKLSPYNEETKMADGGEINSPDKINFEPKTEAELRNSILAIKEYYSDNKKEASNGYYMVQNNFFNEVVSYNTSMLGVLLKVGKELLNKGDRFVVGNLFLPDFKDANTERFFSNLNVPLWTLIPNELRKVTPIKQLSFKPSPKNENLAKITDLFVGTDDLRPNMMGAYFDVTNSAIVATNAHIMVHINEKPAIKEDEICILGKNTKKWGELDENNSKNLQALKDGCLKVDANYPAWSRVIPRDFENIVTVKTEDVYKFCKILVENKLTPPVTNHILLLHEYFKLGVNAAFLADSLKAMLMLGHKEVDFCFQESNQKAIMIIPKGNARKISAVSDNIETDFVLIMPVMLNSYGSEANYNWTYDLDKKCIENEGLEKLGCVDLDTTKEVKAEPILIKPGDFVQKKHTNNKHYLVESVNNDKLTLINTVTLKKTIDANPVDYILVKPSELEGVEYAYNFNKRKAETEELKKQHPIVLEYTEGADIENKPYKNIEELEKDLKSFGFTDTPTKSYIKNKVWFNGYPHYIQIDLSKMDHDFNPEEEKLLTWLKNYDSKFDFEQFSKEIKKKKKQAKKQKVAEIMEAIETLEALLPIMDNAADKTAIRKQIEELDKQLGKVNTEKMDKGGNSNKQTPPIEWKKLESGELEGLTTQYDFYIEEDGEQVILTIFDATEPDKDEAFIDSIEVDTVEEAKTEAQNYIKDNMAKGGEVDKETIRKELLFHKTGEPLNEMPKIKTYTVDTNKSLKELRKEVYDYLIANYLNKKIKNKATGIDIIFTKTGIRKLTHAGGTNKLILLFDIENLVANANPLRVEEITKTNINVKAQSKFLYLFENYVKVNDKIQEFGFSAFYLEDENAAIYYAYYDVNNKI